MLRLPRRSKKPSPPTRALRAFLATETAGGLVLVAATAAALVWANSPWRAGYEALWTTSLAVGVGDVDLELDLRHWVNDALMAIFFLVVGLEVKRELLLGELRDRRTAALPVIAALGGMVVPALLYLAVNMTGDGARGWGIPMATDIAFALGVLAVVARSIPSSLRLFLLTLAIVDDIGAILVIAFFYSSGIDLAWLVAAIALTALIVLGRRAGFMTTPLLLALGAASWLALHASGVHATLAGVTTGFAASAAPSHRSVSEVERLEHHLHGWSSLVVVPLFALANAGVHLGAGRLGDAVDSRVAVGVVLGLVIGKPLGIATAAWLATRTRLADLPEAVTWRQIAGVAALAGIGFTVSLFVASLAFGETSLGDDAKIGIVAASLLASATGAVLLRSSTRDQV